MTSIFRTENDYPHLDKISTLFFEYYQYLHSCGVHMKLTENGEQIWINSVKKSINKTSVLIVCEHKGLVCGFGYGQIKLGPDYLGNLKTGVVAHFYLMEKVRGGNTATAMFEELKKWFVENRWIPAVNALKDKYEYPEWHFIEVANDIRNIKNQLIEKIQSI